MSNGEEDARGPWNEGQGPWDAGEEWEYVEDPIEQVHRTKGQTQKEPEGSRRTPAEAQKISRKLSKERSQQAKKAGTSGKQQWSSYK